MFKTMLIIVCALIVKLIQMPIWIKQAKIYKKMMRIKPELIKIKNKYGKLQHPQALLEKEALYRKTGKISNIPGVIVFSLDIFFLISFPNIIHQLTGKTLSGQILWIANPEYTDIALLSILLCLFFILLSPFISTKLIPNGFSSMIPAFLNGVLHPRTVFFWIIPLILTGLFCYYVNVSSYRLLFLICLTIIESFIQYVALMIVIGGLVREGCEIIL